MSYYLLDHPGQTPQYAFPRRGGGRPSGTIIIHTAECAMDLDGADDSAENCARFIANRADYGSYHRLVDSDSIIAMAPFEYEVWQDTETNGWGIGISAAVAAGRWLEIPAGRRDRIYRNMGAAAAEAVAFMAVRGVAVPIARISGAQARAGVPGFCAHGDSGLYRSDPGAQFDWDLFFDYTRQALSGGLASMGNTEDEIDMAAEENIKARLEEIVRWMDGNFGALAEQSESNRNALAGFVRDVVVNQGTITAAEIDAKFAELAVQDHGTAQLLKGDGEDTVYAWDPGTGFRGLALDEFLALTAAGAVYVELPQTLFDKMKG